MNWINPTWKQDLRRELAGILVVLLVLAAGACALRSAQQTSIGIYDLLATIQDTEDQMFADQLLTQADHQAFNAKLVIALEAERDYNRVVLAGGAGDLTALRTAVRDLAATVGTLASLSSTDQVRLRSIVDMTLTLITGATP